MRIKLGEYTIKTSVASFITISWYILKFAILIKWYSWKYDVTSEQIERLIRWKENN